MNVVKSVALVGVLLMAVVDGWAETVGAWIEDGPALRGADGSIVIRMHPNSFALIEF